MTTRDAMLVYHLNQRQRYDQAGGMLRSMDVALHFFRRPTEEMRRKGERTKPYNERRTT